MGDKARQRLEREIESNTFLISDSTNEGDGPPSTSDTIEGGNLSNRLAFFPNPSCLDGLKFVDNRVVVNAADIKDLDLDPELGILDEEAEAWVGTVDKKVSKKLKEKEIKRQEHIYEFIITEKHHCLTLKVMQKVNLFLPDVSDRLFST